jgi:2-(1,2-epoxy-1,2-dihydrophenyl)acetyl-CoA isomerase
MLLQGADMPYEYLILERREAVGKITLNRPDRLNALCRPLLKELRDALEELAADRAVRAVILTGTGRGFCAGQDLSEAALHEGGGIAEEVAASLDACYHPVLLALAEMRQPVIAQVQGVAAGAGCNLALACDIVVAGESASFLQAFTRIGLVPDCGGTWILPRLVGSARAKALMLLAEEVPGREAAALGMIYRCLPDAELEGGVAALAQRLAQGPTQAYGLIKKAFAEGGGAGYRAQLDLERDLQKEAAASGDFQEGLTAFAAKRPPRFAGS